MKRRNWQKERAGRAVKTAICGLFLIIVVAYVSLVRHVLVSAPTNKNTAPLSSTKRRNAAKESDQANNVGSTKSEYSFWREVAVELAKLPVEQLLQTLNDKDPFGTRAFEKAVAEAENEKGDRLQLYELQKLWPCPSNDRRISLPEQRDQAKAERFRQGNGFLFFQHLRKAGGTNFCTLAEANFPKRELPSYFCMPDYVEFPRQDKKLIRTKKCAGCLHQWTNKEITNYMPPKRIAGNEWDSFDPSRHFDLEAVFVTSFRKPLDRALSQFRFECIEERGCKIKDVGQWWKQRQDLYDVYTWTFSDMKGMRKIATSTAKKDAEKRGEAVGKALDTVSKFHLVLAMEWLSYAEGPVKRVLGFHDTSALFKPVRPHNQRQRNDSWKPSEYLNAEQYKEFSENLALDEILTDAAHRLFLERLVCDDVEA